MVNLSRSTDAAHNLLRQHEHFGMIEHGGGQVRRKYEACHHFTFHVSDDMLREVSELLRAEIGASGGLRPSVPHNPTIDLIRNKIRMR